MGPQRETLQAICDWAICPFASFGKGACSQKFLMNSVRDLRAGENYLKKQSKSANKGLHLALGPFRRDA